jgi:3-hydroxyisobutyrate dehydrogenase-like beta-hydroxyacid dehydrogenase
MAMKVGFIGLGRMGQAMARRMLDAGHEVTAYNRTPEKLKDLAAAGAKVAKSIAEAASFGDAVFTMLTDDAAVEQVVTQKGGILESLPTNSIHVCSGTHGVGIIRKLTAAHRDKGQSLVTAPILGRPEQVLAGSVGVVVSGPKDAIERCTPLFAAIGRRTFEAGDDPAAATAIKLANNFVLGCAIEAMGEGFSLTRKYGVAPDVFYDVMTDGLFASVAYKVYGKIMVDESYDKVGQSAVNGLKDANLALAAGEAVGVPLPSGNVWRDRLVAAAGRGDGNKDWAVMALEQARASGLA